METKIIVDKKYTPKIIQNLDEATYHNDFTAVNSSSLKYIFTSEKAWYHEFHKEWEKPESDAMEFGKLIHKIVLEGPDFLKRYVIEPVFEGLTAKGEVTTSLNATSVKNKRNEWYAEQQANDRIVCTQKDYDRARWMIDSFLGHSDAFHLIKNGYSEVSGYAAHEDTGILGRARADFISPLDGILVDLKTCVDITHNYFLNKRILDEKYRYDLQMAMYKSIFNANYNGKIDIFAWIVLGSQKPWECAVYEPPRHLVDAAENYYNHAMKKVNVALKRKVFHPYQQAKQELVLDDRQDWYFSKAENL